MSVALENWGCIEYEQAHKKQEQYVQDILSEKREEVILFCSHYPVVTLGKSTLKSEIISWGGSVYQTCRGGKATYHGPGQVICYPLLNLKHRQYDLGGLLNALEKAVVQTLERYSLKGTINAHRGDPQKTGVWINEKKIASLGLALKRWVSYHGLAINFFEDPLAFKGINPCGANPETMVSLERLLNTKPDRQDFERHFYKCLLSHLPAISR